jgi:probable HAF family extracellular repeat protein
MKAPRVVALLLALALGPRAAGAFSFTSLGQLCDGCANSQAYAISADGSIVAGNAETTPGGPHQAFVWTQPTGKTPVGSTNPSSGLAMSRDGVWVAGAEGGGPYRWSQGTGVEALPALPGGNGNGQVRDSSSDGSVFVGIANSANTGPASPPTEAFRFDASADEMVGLGDLPGGAFDSTANGVSPDGWLVVGNTTDNGSFAITWSAGPGDDWTAPVISPLAGLIVGGESFAVDASSSGPLQIIIGAAEDLDGWKAVFWDSVGGIHVIGTGVPDGVTPDGTRIVGKDGNGEAFIWDAANGMRTIRSLLPGTEADDWINLGIATDISDDGRTITGFGINDEGALEAWVAVVPEPSAALLTGIGVCMLAPVSRRRSMTPAAPRPSRDARDVP